MAKQGGQTPLYEQVVKMVKDQIVSGVYSKGDLLPSEKEMIDNLGVSRITVRKALSILSLRGIGKVKGFCNKDGQGSPTNQLHTEELDIDIIKSVLNNPMSDYGYGVQKFLQAARELYTEKSYNYIMQKTFDL